MDFPRIASRQNQLVRRAAALAKSAEDRRKEGLFLCEGARLCRDAARSGISIQACFFTGQALEKYREYLEPVLSVCKERYLVSDPVAGLLSSTKTSQGVFCLCGFPGTLQTGVIGFAPQESCLVLENLQDPGNLGTVLRTAEALGVRRIFLLGDCCDPLSPKVLRASMGAVFRAELCLEPSGERLKQLLERYGYRLHAAVPDPAAKRVTEVGFSQGLHAVFIGNEGNGLTAETIGLCHDWVTIPMNGRAESLNASAAATILLWELCRGRTEGGKSDGCG